jgi:hypothetical protein
MTNNRSIKRIELSEDTHQKAKEYCQEQGMKLYHFVDRAILKAMGETPKGTLLYDVMYPTPEKKAEHEKWLKEIEDLILEMEKNSGKPKQETQ